MALHFIFLENMSAPKGADVSALPKSVTIVGDEAHHAIRVKRLAAGDFVRLANGQGATATARIERTMKSSAGFEILTLIEPPGWTLAPQPSVPIEVFASPPKGDRLSTMVDMLGQIGVVRYTPLLTERTEVSANDHKRQRLERVAVETLKQCGRPWLLEIGEPVSFADALTPASHSPTTIYVGDGDGKSLPVLRPTITPGTTVRLLIGPEGGLSPRELGQADSAGATRLALGPHILRTESAAVVGAAALQSWLG